MPSKSVEVILSNCWSDLDGVTFQVEVDYLEQPDMLCSKKDPSNREISSYRIYYQTHPVEEVLEEVLPELGMSLQTLRREILDVIQETL